MHASPFTLPPAARARLRSWIITILTGDPLLGQVKLRRPDFAELRHVAGGYCLTLAALLAAIAAYGWAVNHSFEPPAPPAPIVIASSKITQP